MREPMAGEVRLQWWHDAIERPGSGDARANPVAAALLDTVVRFRLPIATLIALIEARRFDLYNDPMGTWAELEAYCERTSGALFALAARVLDARFDDAAAASRHAGIAVALTGLLRALPLHASRGQLYLPLDLLDRHGARPADILAGRPTAALAAALAELRQTARTHLEAYATIAVPSGLAPAFLSVTLTELYLTRLDRQRNPFRPLEVPQWRRQWRLWRAARRM